MAATTTKMNAHIRQPKKHAKARARVRYTAQIILVVVALLIAGRAYLPIWLTGYVNKTLNNIEGYQGSVSDVDIILLRGAYQIYDLKLEKTGSGIPVPFLDIQKIDLSLQWRALLNGRIVSEVYLTQPVITFAVGENEADTQTGAGADWFEPIEKLMPIDINIVDIDNGTLAYRDFSVTPEVDLSIRDIDAQVENLRNVEDKEVDLPSTLHATGNSVGGGVFKMDGKLNILRSTPDSDLALSLENVNLPALNSYTQKFAAIDFMQGTLNVYSEIITKDGKLIGYVKPLATNIEVVNLQQDKNPIEIVWESIAALVLELFENQPRDQFATKIPLRGELGDVHTAFFPALRSIVYNAFVEAFKREGDNELSFGNVDTKKDEKATSNNKRMGKQNAEPVVKSTDFPTRERVLKR